MAQELVYTSLENGLLLGSRGFSTVAMTEGLAQSTRVLLESLSGYAHKFTGHDADYQRNPVAYSHLKDRSGNSIVSRISAYDFDYTGRTNHLAHHIVLDGAERLPPDGPAAFMSTESVLFREWRGPAKYLPPGRLDMRSFALPSTRSCQAVSWMATPVGAMGAAVLAQSFEESQKGSGVPTVYICFGLDDGAIRDEKLLSLICEALALLPENLRWKVAFSTYFTSLPVGMQCDWRCVLENDPGFARQRAKSIWIDLGTGKIHNTGHLDCTAKLHIAQSGIRPATAKRNEAQSTKKVTPEASRIGWKSNSSSTSPIPIRNSMRTFDADKKRREQESKTRRENIRFGLALVVVVVAFLLGLAFLLHKPKDTSTSSADTEGNSSSSGTNNTQLVGNALTEVEVSESPSTPVKDLNKGEVQPVKSASTPVENGSTEPSGQKEVSPKPKSVGTPALPPESPAVASDANKEIRLISEPGREVPEGQWDCVPYFVEKDNPSNESKPYNPKDGKRPPYADVLLFTKATSPVQYVYQNFSDLKWTELFFSSPTTKAPAAKPPKFRVEKNHGLFRALQADIIIKCIVSTEKMTKEIGTGSNKKAVEVVKVKSESRSLSTDELLEGWTWGTAEVEEFYESAIDIEAYVDYDFVPKNLILQLGTSSIMFKFTLEQKDIEYFRKAQVEEKGVKGGNIKTIENKSKVDPDIVAAVQKCLKSQTQPLTDEQVKEFLEYIVKNEKEVDKLIEEVEKAKEEHKTNSKKKLLAGLKITYTLSVDVSFPEKKPSETFKERYK